MQLRAALFSSALCVLPVIATADTLELSQGQLRQLVSQQQVLSAEVVVTDAATQYNGVVMDIRGFLSEGRMTYRLLVKRDDGSVIELLVNGVDGRRISHNSPMGQVVSSVARSTSSVSNSGNNRNNGNRNNRGNAGNNENRGNSGNNDNRGNSGNNDNRGNSGNNGNRGNSGNNGGSSNGNNGKGRGN